MDIIAASGSAAHIVIVPREFKTIDGCADALEIVSTAIDREVKETLGLSFFGPLVLNTPFYSDGTRCFYITAQTRRPSFLDRITNPEKLYGVLFVSLSEKELIMLYSLQYPKKTPDMEAIHAVLAGQAEVIAELAQKKE